MLSPSPGKPVLLLLGVGASVAPGGSEDEAVGAVVAASFPPPPGTEDGDTGVGLRVGDCVDEPSVLPPPAEGLAVGSVAKSPLLVVGAAVGWP